MKDQFGDRMNLLEGQESDRKFLPLLPICIRLDGKSFHKFTKELQRPFDLRMINLMQEVTKFLVAETGAKIGYTQSDEISLILYSDRYESQTFFNGRIQKLVSVICSMCTAKFNELRPQYISEKKDKLAYFDCRVWQVPTLIEAVNNILWREKNATKNAISMAAQHYYSHKELLNKNSKEKQEMLFAKEINFNDYPVCFKRGTFIQKKTITRMLSSEEFEKHPIGSKLVDVERSVVSILDMPSFTTVINRVAVIFEAAVPQTT